MDVRVSPRVTVCVFPEARAASAAAELVGVGVGSPINHAWFRHLLLKLENLLRERVDLGVLFIQLFADRFQLRGIRFLVRRLRPRQGREKYGRRRYRQDFHRSHVDIWL